jgi:hypothetical protein
VFHFGRSLSQVVLHPDHCDLQWIEEKFASSDRDAFKFYFLKYRADDISKDINQNIAAMPPYRVSCFNTPDHVFLALSIHHSLFDGIALPCLIREVERDYLGRKYQPVAPAGDILRLIEKINRNQARAFWTSHFEGFAWPQLKSLSYQHTGSHHHSVSFVSPLSTIKLLASSQCITLQALFTGAFALHAARNIYKSTDVVFGVSHSIVILAGDLCVFIGFAIRSPSACRFHRISHSSPSLRHSNTRQFQQHAKQTTIHSRRDFIDGRIRTFASRQCTIVDPSWVSVVRCSLLYVRRCVVGWRNLDGH